MTTARRTARLVVLALCMAAAVLFLAADVWIAARSGS
jgi:hypothetical protein